MTSVVGILCKDGVVIGTDSAATLGDGFLSTIEQPTDKLDVIDDKIIVAGTGQAGLGQRFCLQVQLAWRDELAPGRYHPVEACRRLCAKVISDFASTRAPFNQYGALVAFPADEGPQLCEFCLGDLQPELLQTDRLWYTSMGSAKAITDPFLGLMRRVFWQDGPPSVAEGVLAVCWTLEHAIELNIGGVSGPIRAAVLERDSDGQYAVRRLQDSEFEEHRQNVEGAYRALRDYRPGVGSAAVAAGEMPPKLVDDP